MLDSITANLKEQKMLFHHRSLGKSVINAVDGWHSQQDFRACSSPRKHRAHSQQHLGVPYNNNREKSQDPREERKYQFSLAGFLGVGFFLGGEQIQWVWEGKTAAYSTRTQVLHFTRSWGIPSEMNSRVAFLLQAFMNTHLNPTELLFKCVFTQGQRREQHQAV